MTRYVFITGGVVSSLGKGLASAALGALLQARGFTVRLRKLDPYLNVDPGTMSPTQHGEVYVTDDGAETDLDLGHYERFTGVPARRSDNVTSGRIYQSVIERERRGDYLGATIQVIPHVTDEIKAFIATDAGEADFVLCEIGGTVGDIESLPFLEAIRQHANQIGRERAMFIHLTLVPYLRSAGELKTKPTQHSVKELQSVGIQPDIILCRCERELPLDERPELVLQGEAYAGLRRTNSREGRRDRADAVLAAREDAGLGIRALDQPAADLRQRARLPSRLRLYAGYRRREGSDRQGSHQADRRDLRHPLS